MMWYTRALLTPIMAAIWAQLQRDRLLEMRKHACSEARRHRHALMLNTYMDLAIGPRPHEDPEKLRPIFEEHRRRFDDGDWCVEFFEGGIDQREQDNDDELVEVPGIKSRR